MSVLKTSLAPPFPWSSTQFLQPVIPDDPLLQLDFEDDTEELEDGVTAERGEEHLVEEGGTNVAELAQKYVLCLFVQCQR